MELKLLISRNVIFGICPNCKEEMTLERVKTKSKAEKIFLSIIKFKKYHCKSCKWYGNLFIYTFPRNIKKVLLNYLFLTILILTSIVLFTYLLKNTFNP
jgi:hypothetical protein